MFYPNGYLLLRNVYRAVFERIGAGAIGATSIFPRDFRVNRSAFLLLVRQLVTASKGILGLVGPEAKGLHGEESIWPRFPNLNLFLSDAYCTTLVRKAA